MLGILDSVIIVLSLALVVGAVLRAAGFRLLCPYDTDGLDPDVVAAAHGTHPHVCGHRSPGYRDTEAAFAEPLPGPAGPASTMRFDGDNLQHLCRARGRPGR